ncbi:hypothetical protein GCM10027347_58950 [Larkinella harenae]
MSNVLLPAPRKKKKKLQDMGDSTHAPVFYIETVSTANASGDVILPGPHGTYKRLRDMGDGTHAEVVFLSTGRDEGADILLPSERGTYRRLESMAGGTHARVLSDIDANPPGGDTVLLPTARKTFKKLKDTGTGFSAEVLFGVSNSSASPAGDVLIPSERGSFRRLRDMGDGTHAEVVYSPASLPSLSFDWSTTTSLTSPQGITLLFSRASGATIFDANSKIIFGPENLIANSGFTEGVTGATPTGWIDRGSTSSVKTPDGSGGFVDRITVAAPGSVGSTNDTRYGFTNLLAGIRHTISFDISLAPGSVSGSIILLMAGLSQSINLTSTTKQRVSFQITPTLATHSLFFGSNTTPGIVFEIARIQFERGTVARAYNPTTSGPYFGPRWDTHPLTKTPRGVLIEPQSTNILLWSQDLTNQSVWGRINITPSQVAIANPLDLPTVTKQVETTASAQHQFSYGVAAITANTTYTGWVIAKAAERSRMFLQFSSVGASWGGDSKSAIFDLSTGAIVNTVGASVIARMEPIGDDWYLCAITATTPGSVTVSGVNVGNVQDGTTISYTGDGVSGLYVLCAQMEAHQWPTSYIPTAGSTVTRAIDRLYTAINPLWYNQGEGTAYVSFVPRSRLFNRGIFSFSDGTANNRVDVRSIDAQTFITVGGAGQSAPATTTLTEGMLAKVALAFKAGDTARAANGVVAKAAPAQIPTNISLFQLGNVDNLSTTQALFGWIREFAYYPTRLSDAQIAEMTNIPVATFFGDSIVAGTGAAPATVCRWTRLLCDAMGWVENNKGLGGSTLSKRTPVNPLGTTNMVDRISEIPAFTNKGDKLVMAFGMNDWGVAAAAYTPTAFVQDYRTVLNHAITVKGWPRSSIYLVTPSYPADAAFAFYAGINGGNTPTRANIQLFTQATLNVASEYSVKSINMYNPMAVTPSIATYLRTDGVHPINKGHALMYSIAKAAMQ